MVLNQPAYGLMKIAHALRATNYRCLAFVGSGGKSSAMFQTARQTSPPVILAVTTHLAVSQTALADQWFVAESIQDLPEAGAVSGLRVLFTGAQDQAGKVGGVSGVVLEQILALAEKLACPLLVEADGARGLPLKAPAEYEPVIPSFCDLVIVTAGVSALGKPLDEEWVHRVNNYAELSGLVKGEKITPEGGSPSIAAPAWRVEGNTLRCAEGCSIEPGGYCRTTSAGKKTGWHAFGQIRCCSGCQPPAAGQCA